MTRIEIVTQLVAAHISAMSSTGIPVGLYNEPCAYAFDQAAKYADAILEMDKQYKLSQNKNSVVGVVL